MGMTDLVLAGVLWWVDGYTTVQWWLALVRLRWSMWGSCMKMKSVVLWSTWFSMSSCTMSNLLRFCCQNLTGGVLSAIVSLRGVSCNDYFVRSLGRHQGGSWGVWGVWGASLVHSSGRWFWVVLSLGWLGWVVDLHWSPVVFLLHSVVFHPSLWANMGCGWGTCLAPIGHWPSGCRWSGLGSHSQVDGLLLSG